MAPPLKDFFIHGIAQEFVSFHPNKTLSEAINFMHRPSGPHVHKSVHVVSYFFQFPNVLQRSPQDVAVHQLNSIFASSEVPVEVQKLRRTNTPEVFINDKDGGVLTGSSMDLLSKFTVSYTLMEIYIFSFLL